MQVAESCADNSSTKTAEPMRGGSTADGQSRDWAESHALIGSADPKLVWG